MRPSFRAALAATLLATLVPMAAESQSSASAPVSGSSGASTGTASGGSTPLGPYSGPQVRTWTTCGGLNLFSLACAAVRVTVDGTATSIAVQNLSGSPDVTWQGLHVPSAGQWVITKVGFDNVGSAVSTTRTVDTEGPWYARTATPRDWSRFDDKQYGGGERIDLGITNGTGISGGIASSCAPQGSLPGGNNRLWMTPNPDCTQNGVTTPDGDPWFETDLLTTTAWDPNASNVTVYFKAQNGPGGASYECILGGATGRGGCYDVDPYVADGGIVEPGPGQVVPEPGTLVLMATGVAGLGMLAWRRRTAMAALTHQ
jgi:hypothetical protein